MSKQKGNIYFNEVAEGLLDDEHYDAFLYQANKVLYDYGDHQKANRRSLVSFVKSQFRPYLRHLHGLKYLFEPTTNKGVVLSNAYVDLHQYGVSTALPPWHGSFSKDIRSNRRLNSLISKITSILDQRSISSMLSEHFLSIVRQYELEFSHFLSSREIQGLVVSNDLSFFENVSIKVARKSGIPSFVYLHGLPGRYNHIDDNRADYLIVWGQGLKELYIRNGVKPDKILNLAHPHYSNFEPRKLKSTLENVIVISKAMSGTPSSSDEITLTDRSKSLFYAERMKSLLLQLGVQRARLRLHPSESESFYAKNLIGDFFTIDRKSKEQTLKEATLVVGPTSTMLLDSILQGVNYILFDPLVDSLTLENTHSLVPPFDGSSFIKLSADLRSFKEHIANPDLNIDWQELKLFFSTNQEDHIRFMSLFRL